MNGEATPAERSSKRFSRREWLFLIALLLMIEAWTLNLSYSFKSEQDVINYVSFASTIASLLLAVIAIIYGYYQSDGAQRASALVEKQLARMQSSQDSLESTTRELQSQFKSVSAATDLLDALRSSVESTHSKLGALEGGVSSLRSAQDALQATLAAQKSSTASSVPSTANQHDPKIDALAAVFRRTSFTCDVIGYALFHALSTAGKMRIPLWSFISKFVEEPMRTGENFSLSPATWHSLTSQSLLILAALNVLTVKVQDDADASYIEVSDRVFSALSDMAKQTANYPRTAASANQIAQVKW